MNPNRNLEIKIPINVHIDTETARLCTNLLSVYYGEPVNTVNLETLAKRLVKLQAEHKDNICEIENDDDLKWLMNEIEQVCLIPMGVEQETDA